MLNKRFAAFMLAAVAMATAAIIVKRSHQN
jgi:hypothetical protein